MIWISKKKYPGTVLYLIMFMEISISIGSFLFGPEGLSHVHTLRHEQKNIQVAVQTLKTEVKQLQTTLRQWHHTTFYREQLAREQLQMAYDDDIIYYIKKTTAQ